jgi:hypothetical protein
MRTQGEHIRTLRRRVDFLKAREHKNSYDLAELGALEWVLVSLPPQSSKPWQGLVQEEFERLVDEAGFTRSDLLMMGACVEQIVDLVETKLKEKNAL